MINSRLDIRKILIIAIDRFFVFRGNRKRVCIRYNGIMSADMKFQKFMDYLTDAYTLIKIQNFL